MAKNQNDQRNQQSGSKSQQEKTPDGNRKLEKTNETTGSSRTSNSGSKINESKTGNQYSKKGK